MAVVRPTMPPVMRTLLLLLALAIVPLVAAETVAAPAPEAKPAPAVAAKPDATAKPRVAFLPIDGVIDDHRASQFERALAQAMATKPDIIVARIATDGGHLGSAMDMLEMALKVDPKTKLVAFIDNRAYSAGALIAYGCDRIYMTSQAYIGDIGVITVDKDGKIEYLPEKIESPVRALLRQAAQHNGWDEAKLQKMTARNQELWRIQLGEGAPRFVIADDLPKVMAENPALRRDGDRILRGDEGVGFVVAGKDRLLTYTAKEAVAEGMATALVADLDSTYRLLGVEPAQVTKFEPSQNERLAETLGGWAPLLAGLAVLFLVLEFKMPSGGLFLIGAAVCGAAFLVTQYWLQLAGAPEIILIGLGLAAVVAEIFFLPTGGILGIAGLVAIASGLILAFMPDNFQFQVGDERWGSALGAALRQSLLALGVMTAGVVVMISSIHRTRAMKVLASEVAVDGTSAGTVEAAAASLVGRRVQARTMLRPSGFVTVDGRDVPATVQHGEMVAAGSEVEIVGASFGELVVRPVPIMPGNPA